MDEKRYDNQKCFTTKGGRLMAEPQIRTIKIDHAEHQWSQGLCSYSQEEDRPPGICSASRSGSEVSS